MRSSVDLPQPLGPTMQTNSPGVDAQIDVVERDEAVGPFLAQPLDLDRRAALHAQRQPGSLLSWFSSANGPSFFAASST